MIAKKPVMKHGDYNNSKNITICYDLVLPSSHYDWSPNDASNQN